LTSAICAIVVESVAGWYRESSVPPERFAQTLAHVADRIAEGIDPRVATREFLDELAIRPTRELRLAAVAREPRRVGERSDALLAAFAEHVALREDEPPPSWALEGRSLPRPHVVRQPDGGLPRHPAARVAGGLPPARHLPRAVDAPPGLTMRREEIVAALEALAAELHELGIDGEMYVVGGAAIAIAFDARRSTRDIDAVFEPKAAIYAAAERVGSQRGLPVGWLNDGVEGFLAGPDRMPRRCSSAPACASSSRRPGCCSCSRCFSATPR